MWRRSWVAVTAACSAIVIALAVYLPMASPDQGQPPPRERYPGWQLTWSDEFNGPAGSPPDPRRWGYQTGGKGWGNEELEYYTDSTENASLDGKGHLVITARRNHSDLSCWYGACRYTSARLVTQDKFAQMYGRFEARIKLPRGKGMWPAFWMLGHDVETAGYPESGEIDVMEYLGHQLNIVHGSVHSPDYDSSVEHAVPATRTFAAGFHTFTVDWTPTSITFYADGRAYDIRTKAEMGDGWVFDKPFFLLLNLAVGGNWPGSPNSATMFPQRMVVDYVRAYRRTGSEPQAPPSP